METYGAVYGLVDPRTRELRYIGQSTNVARRVRRHLTASSMQGETHKNRWLRGLIAGGFKPEFFVIDNASSKEELNQAERFFIAYFRALGARLTNTTDGGDGLVRGSKRSPEIRARLSVALKGRHVSRETCARISAAKTGKKLGVDVGLRQSRARGSRPLVDQFGDTYENDAHAARVLLLSPGMANRVARGQMKQTKGYVFAFIP